MSARRYNAGATLIELIFAIIIIGSVSATMVGVLSSMSKQSAETMVALTATNIAQAYLQEILDKPLIDPDGVDGSEPRELYDNIDDYLRLPDTTVRDRFGAVVPNLGGYQVAVSIQNTNLLPGVPTAQTRSVQVTVTSPLGDQTIVRGVRTRHE